MGRRQVDRQAVAVAVTEMAVVAVAVAVAGLRAKNVQDTSSERRQNLNCWIVMDRCGARWMDLWMMYNELSECSDNETVRVGLKE